MPILERTYDSMRDRDGASSIDRLISATAENLIREAPMSVRTVISRKTGLNTEIFGIPRPGESHRNEMTRTEAMYFVSELSAGLLLQVKQNDPNVTDEAIRGSYPDVKKQTVPATKWLAALKGYSRPEDIADLEKDAVAMAGEMKTALAAAKKAQKNLDWPLSLRWIVGHYDQLYQAHPGVFALPVLIAACYLPSRFAPEKPEWWGKRSKFTDALDRLQQQYSPLKKLA